MVPGAEFLYKGTNPEVDSYSAFFDNIKSSTGSTGLDQKLLDAGVTTVYVSGVATDFCVGFTSLDAIDVGFTTFMVDDLARGVENNGIAAMKRRIREAGGILVNSEQVVSDTEKWKKSGVVRGGASQLQGEKGHQQNGFPGLCFPFLSGRR